MLCVGLLVVGIAMKKPTDEDRSINFPEKQVSEILSPDKGGIIRGFNFNMTKEDIAHLEKSTKEYTNHKRYMSYTVRLSSADFEFADIYYEFDKEGLFMITVETFQKDERSASKLYGAIKRHFDGIIGHSYMSDDGYLVWTDTDSKTGVQYEVAMLDI